MLDVCSWTEIDRKLYFKAYMVTGGTFVYDIDNKKLYVIDENIEYDKWSPNAYLRVASLGNKLIFPPYFTSNLDFFIYDTSNDEKKYIKKEKFDPYRSCVIYKKKAYALGKKICNIAEIDMENYTISYPFIKAKEDFYMTSFSNACICENYVYVNTDRKDAVLRINLEEYDYKLIELPKYDAEYGTIVKYDGYFYLTGNKNWILKWDGNDFGEKILLPENDNEEECISWKQFFSDVIEADGKLYMAPLYYRAAISFDCKTSQVKRITDIEDGLITWGITKYDDFLCFPLVKIDGKMRKYMRINIKNGEISDDDIFDFDEFEELNLCKYGVEYSKHALKNFIEMI